MGAYGVDRMATRTDERSGPWTRPTASSAKRITLLCWLLVLTLAASAECAWVLWFQALWTAAPTAAGPRPAPRVSPSARIAQWPTNPAP